MNVYLLLLLTTFMYLLPYLLPCKYIYNNSLTSKVVSSNLICHFAQYFIYFLYTLETYILLTTYYYKDKYSNYNNLQGSNLIFSTYYLLTTYYHTIGLKCTDL